MVVGAGNKGAVDLDRSPRGHAGVATSSLYNLGKGRAGQGRITTYVLRSGQSGWMWFFSLVTLTRFHHQVSQGVRFAGAAMVDWGIRRMNY